MKFSIIIPNLNSPIIDRTLDALINQIGDTSDCEIIVIGQDKPGLVRESARTRFVRTEKPVGPATARNIGIRGATGEIIGFVDADCIPDPGWLEQMRCHFLNPQVVVLGGGVDCRPANYWMLCGHVSSFHEYQVTAPAGTRRQLPSLNLCIRRDALERVGLFDESRPIAEDSDLTTRLRLQGYALHFDPRVSVTHSPRRADARSVFRHAYAHGYHSIFVDRRWRDRLHMPWPFRHAALLALTSPFIALVVTAWALWRDRTPVRWWSVAPAVFGLKLAYCWGGVAQLSRGRA